MDALAAQTPETLPWADIVRYSENSVSMDIGDGIWGAASGHGAPVLEAADPRTGQVAWFGVVEEHGQPAFFAVRLEVAGGKIAEAEAVVRRRGGPPQWGDTSAYRPDLAFAQALPAKARPGRDRLKTIVNGYFDALAGGAPARAALDPRCTRIDNGLDTTSGPGAEGGVAGCEAQIRARVFKPIAAVRARHFPIVDETRGVVVATGFFDLPARAPKPAEGKGLSWAADYPYSVGFITAFKVRGGKLWRIQSVSDAQPYLMPSPFEGR